MIARTSHTLILPAGSKLLALLFVPMRLLALSLFALSFFVVPFAVPVSATAATTCESNCARNRNDVLDILDTLKSNWPEASAKVWVNANDPQPVVKVGDRVAYSMSSKLPAHFTLIYLDSKGAVTVLKPDAVTRPLYPFPSKYTVYPALSEACPQFENKDQCFRGDDYFLQGDPVGRDSLLLVASQAKLEDRLFSLTAGTDYAEIGKNLDAVNSLVNGLRALMQTSKVDVARYSYEVEADTQYTTRAIRMKINSMENAAANNSSASESNTVAQVSSETSQPVTPEAAGAPMVFNNINFESNSYDLLPEAKRELDTLGSALVDRQADGGMPIISLTGHTDSIGTSEYNQELSTKRAQAVERYLQFEHGIDKANLAASGAGESFPVMSNKTDRGRSLNRRVEVSVIAR